MFGRLLGRRARPSALLALAVCCGAAWALPLAAAQCGTLELLRGRVAAAKPAAPLQTPRAPIEVGERHQFVHAFNAAPVTATCRWVSERVYIFVEDSRWDENGGLVDQGHVDILGRLMEESTPAEAGRGIYDISVEAFGPVPDVDGDGRVAVVIGAVERPGIIGFFDPNVATHPTPELRWDAVFLEEFAVRRDTYLARGTLAHEFQHLIHWGQDDDEATWVNEGLSGYAEELNGYPEADPAAVRAFLGQPGVGLLFPPFAENNAAYYGSTYLFMSYMAEEYGAPYIRSLVAQERNGAAGIDAALEAGGWAGDFVGVWSRWNVANYASQDPALSYGALQGRRDFTLSLEGALPLASGFLVGEQWGSVNIIVRAAGDLAIDFVGQELGRFRVWLYGWRGGLGELLEVDLADGFSGSGELAGVDSLALIVGRTSRLGSNFDFTVRRFVPTAVADGARPEALDLAPAYPNPFNSQVQLELSLGRGGGARLEVFDVLGRRVRTVAGGFLGAGRHRFSWDGLDDDGRPAASGVYRVRLLHGGRSLVRSVTLVK